MARELLYCSQKAHNSALITSAPPLPCCLVSLQIALIWGLLASACCILYPIIEAGPHILNIISHLIRCQTQETREEAVLDTVKDVMPPKVGWCCLPADPLHH